MPTWQAFGILVIALAVCAHGAFAGNESSTCLGMQLLLIAVFEMRAAAIGERIDFLRSQIRFVERELKSMRESARRAS